MESYDAIIIGAGAAGLTSAIYSARYNVSVLVLGKIAGGVASEAVEVHNFPSYENIKGFELMAKMIKHVKGLGIEIRPEEVKDIKKSKVFKVVTNKREYSGKNVIIATGTERRKMGLDKEREFVGKGVSYCATCDAGFYKDKIVGVAGGGDSALTTALLASKFAKKVYIIYRKDKFFRGEPALVKEVEKDKKIESVFNAEISELLGEGKLCGVRLKDGKEIALDGIFVEIGSTPNVELAEKLGCQLDNGYIKTDKGQKTNVGGIFGAGDVTNNLFKQIVTACSEGAIAMHSAYERCSR